MKPATFTAINYSLRPSKTIQRGLVFEGLRRLQERLDWKRAAYVGLGSIWFTDFVLAHKLLGISRMVSIEENMIGYRRARFNKPYKFVEVKRGRSFDVLPALFDQPRFANIPTILWLDYDGMLGEEMVDELRSRIVGATDDSVVLVTFDASARHYGNDSRQRLDRLSELFGPRATRDLKRNDVRDINLAVTMAGAVMDLFRNVSTRISKPNACVPAFQIPYKDKAAMVTVGAVFPREDRLHGVRQAIEATNWPGLVEEAVIAPHLTSREVAVLQAMLPSRQGLSRAFLRELGFDLEVEQLRAFQEYYRHYPTFAQILS